MKWFTKNKDKDKCHTLVQGWSSVLAEGWNGAWHCPKVYSSSVSQFWKGGLLPPGGHLDPVTKHHPNVKTNTGPLVAMGMTWKGNCKTVSFSITDNVSLKTVTRASAGNIRIVLCRLNDQGPQRTAQGIDAIWYIVMDERSIAISALSGWWCTSHLNNLGRRNRVRLTWTNSSPVVLEGLANRTVRDTLECSLSWLFVYSIVIGKLKSSTECSIYIFSFADSSWCIPARYNTWKFRYNHVHERNLLVI